MVVNFSPSVVAWFSLASSSSLLLLRLVVPVPDEVPSVIDAMAFAVAGCSHKKFDWQFPLPLRSARPESIRSGGVT
jgi:hypothetical protein